MATLTGGEIADERTLAAGSVSAVNSNYIASSPVNYLVGLVSLVAGDLVTSKVGILSLVVITTLMVSPAVTALYFLL